MKCALNSCISAAPIEEYCISQRFTSPSLGCFPHLRFPICFFMAIAEAQRDKERNLSHLYDSTTPGLGPLLLEQHNYDISRPVVKVPFLSARMATKVFSLHFGEMKRKIQSTILWAGIWKRTWTARKAPTCSNWWIKLIRQQLLTRKITTRHSVNPTISSAASNETTSLHEFTVSLLEVEENSQHSSTWNIVFLMAANGQSEHTACRDMAGDDCRCCQEIMSALNKNLQIPPSAVQTAPAVRIRWTWSSRVGRRPMLLAVYQPSTSEAEQAW